MIVKMLPLRPDRNICAIPMYLVWYGAATVQGDA